MGEVFEDDGRTMRLLVVEDDTKLVRALERGLGREGYSVDVASTGDEGLAQATDQDYDAVVLDLMLPGVDGVSLCQTLRRRGRWVPVLMLTARGEVGDRIRGLDSGADDYLVKPFDFGELLARLRALIRRGPAERSMSLDVGDLRIDPSTRIVTRAGHQVELTGREFDVLEVLARDAGRLVTREALLDAVWAGNPEGSPNVVDVYVGYLRRKLEQPVGRRLIRTVRGKGFVLEREP
jgi:two-component system, OmpR family, response regulator